MRLLGGFAGFRVHFACHPLTSGRFSERFPETCLKNPRSVFADTAFRLQNRPEVWKVQPRNARGGAAGAAPPRLRATPCEPAFISGCSLVQTVLRQKSLAAHGGGGGVAGLAQEAGRANDGHALAGQFVKEHRLADVRRPRSATMGFDMVGPPFRLPFQDKKRGRRTASLSSLSAKSLSFNRNDFTAIVVAASLAGSVRQAGLAALRASYDAGDRQFPVGAASLISSCAGYFSLGYCHVVHLLGLNARRHIIYLFIQ